MYTTKALLLLASSDLVLNRIIHTILTLEGRGKPPTVKISQMVITR